MQPHLSRTTSSSLWSGWTFAGAGLGFLRSGLGTCFANLADFLILGFSFRILTKGGSGSSSTSDSSSWGRSSSSSSSRISPVSGSTGGPSTSSVSSSTSPSNSASEVGSSSSKSTISSFFELWASTAAFTQRAVSSVRASKSSSVSLATAFKIDLR